MKKYLQGILFIVVGVTILYLVYLNQQSAYLAQCQLDGVPETDCSLIDKVIEDFMSVDIFWIIVVLILFILSNVARALRWLQLLEPMGYKVSMANSFFAIMLGYFANLGFPRIGEVVRAGSLAKYENIPVEKVVGTVVTDRIMDVVLLGLIILLAFTIEYNLIFEQVSALMNSGEVEKEKSFLIYYLLVGGGLIMLAFYLLRNKIKGSTFYKKVVNFLTGLWEGIISIKDLKRPGLFIFYSVFIWLCYFLMTYFCFFAFEPVAGLSLTAGLIVFVFGSLGIVVPAPGGMGSYHFLVIYALTLYGISNADGFSFANILFFSIQIFCNVFLGIIALIALPLINKGKPQKVVEEL